MKGTKQLLSISLSMGFILSNIPVAEGAGLLAENGGSAMLRRAGSVPVTLNLLQSSVRHYTSSLFKGKYVTASPEGLVTIKQAKYPTYKGVQGLSLEPKVISETSIENYDVLCVNFDETDLTGPFEAVTNGHSINRENSPFTINLPENTIENPYSSLGKLEIIFPSNINHFIKPMCAKAVAIDRNLIITSAHSFFPKNINGHLNTENIRAETVIFNHMLKSTYRFDPQIINSPYLTVHIFVHPEWEKNFNSEYDVALAILSNSVNLTDAQLQHQLKQLNVSQEKRETIRIIAPSEESSYMNNFTDKSHEKQKIYSKNIVYHFANTIRESNDHPSIADTQYIITTDTPTVDSETNGANGGVRMRRELLPFIDDSIRKHQEFLDNMDKIEEHQQKEKRLQEQALIDKSEKAAKIEIASKLKAMNLALDQITNATGLTVEEINSIQ